MTRHDFLSDQPRHGENDPTYRIGYEKKIA
jgi:hypothetical protein